MEKEIERILQQLVSINSVYPKEYRLASYLSDFFKKKSFIVKKQMIAPGRYNLLLEKGLGKKSVLLYSHMDTVSVTNGWKTNPFKLITYNDKAYGLGSWDMKGGMAVNIITFLNFQPKNYKLKLVFCVDEENISEGGHKLIGSDFMKDIDCVISSEPAFEYGLNGIVIGRIGRAVYEIEITGQSRHYALYEKKFDINLLTGELLNDLTSFYRRESATKKQFIFARRIESAVTGMSIPPKTMLELDSAIIPPENHRSILAQLKKNASKLNKQYDNNFKIRINLKKRKTPFLDSYEIHPKNPYLKTMQSVIEESTKKKTVPYFRTSVADENIFGSHGKTVLGIGPEGGNAHAPNEWVSLSSLNKLYIILSNYLRTIDKYYDLGR